MAQLDNEALIRESIDAFNANDMQRWGATVTENTIYNGLGTQRSIEGRDAVIEALQGWKCAFPDAIGTITNVVSADNQVAFELTWTGTHTGDLVGAQGTIPATGKNVDLQATQIATIKDGQIIELHHYFDMGTLLQQIGADQ